MDAFNLKRFLSPQDAVITAVMSELLAGTKSSHWMWFIFPQMRGLGTSQTAQFYGIRSLGEAEAYLRHPVLGERLRLCTRTVLSIDGASARDIFGAPDDMKFRSSMTLFDAAEGGSGDHLYRLALERFFNGHQDQLTLRLLENTGSAP